MTQSYIMKWVKTYTLIASIICAIVLVFIGGPSLSFFDNSDYTVWYDFMHGFAAIFFAFNAGEFKKMGTSFFLPYGMLMISAIDMHKYSELHTAITVIVILVALYSILFNVKESLKSWPRWLIVVLAIAVFVIGYYTDFIGFAFAETFVMGSIAAALLKEIHG